MANKGGTITIQELITKDALEWGKPYELNVQKAIEKNQQFISSLKEMNALYLSMKGVKNETELVSSKEKEIQLTRVTTATYKEQQSAINEIVRTKAQLLTAENKEHKQLADLRVTKGVVNKLTKEEAVLNNALVGAYQKLNTQREQAKTKLRDLIASQTASNKTIKQAQAEYDKLNQKVRFADKATGDFTKNVGNYKSAFGKASFAVSQLAGAFGLVSAVAVAMKIFNDTRELNALNVALKNVTETTEMYAETQRYLLDLAEISGVEYTKLSGAYTKFYASAKETNLTLAETQKIFSSVTKASASLGLSSEDTEGSLKALAQMLSKGKVSAEELRGQLGDRMPGAFQIMAKSIGVTTSELDKMLKDGKVIAEDVLPKFALELERSFGVDNNNKIETINASIGRMKNAWTAFIQSLSEGKNGTTSFFGGIIDGLTASVQILQFASENFGMYLDLLFLRFSDFQKKVDAFNNKRQVEQGAKDTESYYQRIMENSAEYGRTIEEETELEQNLLRQKMLNQSIIVNNLQQNKEHNTKELKSAEKLLSQYQRNWNSLEDATVKLKEYQKSVKDTTKTEETAGTKRVKVTEILEGTVAWYDEQIKVLRDEQKTLATTREQYKIYEFTIKSVEEAKKKLIDATNDLIKAEKEGAESIGDITPEELPAQRIYGIQLEARKKLKDLDEQELEDFKENWQKRIDIVQSALSEIGNLVNQVFENRIASIQAEMDANEDYYEHQMTLADEDSEQQNLLEEERFLKSEKLRKRMLAEKQKQAKYEKAFNIMQIGLNTASAVVEALPNIPLSIYAGVLGALQLATAIATPIPKYKQGTENHKGGFAIVGDGGVSEVVAEPNKRPYLSPNTDTLVNLEKGTKVFPNIEAYKKYMGDLERASILTSFHNENQKMKDVKGVFDFNLLNLQTEIKNGFKNARIQNQNNIKVDLNFSYWKNKNINF